MRPDWISNPGPLFTSQVLYQLRYAARLVAVINVLIFTLEMKFLCFNPSRLRLEDLKFGLFWLFSHISDINTYSCGLTRSDEGRLR